MDERYRKGLSPRHRKSIAVRILLLLLCAFILCGGYTLQHRERNRKNSDENIQDNMPTIDTYEKESSVIKNEYQTKFQDAANAYEIKDGKLFGSGENSNGQLGNGTARPVRSEWYAKEGNVYSNKLVYVMDDVAFIAADYYTAAAISKRGDLWVWGDNSFGEIGNSRRGNGMPSASTDVVSEPYLVLKDIKGVWFEDFTVYEVDFQDQEYSWGKNAAASPKPVSHE